MSINYEFAHKQLPTFAFSKPFHLLGWLSHAEGRQTLAEYWNHLAGEIGAPGGIKGENFQSEIRTWKDGSQAGILRLPKAEEPNDAVMIAVVVTLGARRWLILRAPPTVRYFTLERMMRQGDEPERFALCEWARTEAGVSHALYDALPEATPGAFSDAAEKIARGEIAGA